MSSEKKEVQSPVHKDPEAKPAAATEEPAKEEPKPHPSGLSADERYALIRSVGEECIMDEELKKMVTMKPSIRCYDGFEPSGRMHIAQGVFKAVNVNKCTKVGCEFVFWVADWFALMNDKMGGELERIKTVGQYLVEVWRAAGMDMTQVKFLWSSDEINTHADEYWKIVLDVARRNSLARIKKCCTIMGKAEGNLSAAQILYPLMQCADIFFLKADVCQLGKDQRKVNMLAREYCDMIKKKLKPVILSHHMLSGLKKGQAKMSKSDPDSAIFMEDSAEEVARKIRGAYCPRVQQKKIETGAEDSGLPDADDEKNPVLDYIECIVLSAPGTSMDVGKKTFTSYAELEEAFLKEEVTEDEVKEGLIVAINKLLDPVRDHFKNDEKAAKLLETIKEYKNLPPPEAAAPKPARATPLSISWLPAEIKLPLATAQQLVANLTKFLKDNKDAESILLLPDWASFARNEVTGDMKEINGVLDYNANLLKALGLPEAVKVQKQSAVILKNPNDYWVTTIGVGRKRNLDVVGKANGGTLETAGQVISCLMRAADAVHLEATHIVGLEADKALSEFVTMHTDGKVATVDSLPTVIPNLCEPGKTAGPNERLYCDDTDMDINSKVKKAYCAPEESKNPIIELLTFFVQTNGEVEIPRSEKDGGNYKIATVEELVEKSGSGALHPGDAKKALGPLVLKFTETARAAVKKPSPEMKSAATIVKTAAKKLAKK